jgi:para-nitrobenzyl esterase
MKKYFISCLLLSFLLYNAISGQSPIVNTQYGQVAGNLNEEVFEFLGIPFASPPVGDLRWRPPVEPESWNEVLQTREFQPKCPQKNFTQGDSTFTIEGEESCLFLNIWTPDTVSNDLAVMVFIHGGGNQQGSANEFTLGTEIYNGKNLSHRGNVVVVTIQYRLGPLGFLVHPGLELENNQNTSGNYAVMDQILALEWVQNNISNFGGDASKVMIFGESAGGVNVGNLLATPLAEGLFSRACIQSATPTLQNYTDSRTYGIEFVDSLTNAGNDTEKISYLRSLHPESIIQSLESPLSGGFVKPKWKPVMDQYIFENFPFLVFQTGDYNKVPVIIGSNADEMSLPAPQTVLPFMVDILINLYVPEALRPLAHELYPSGTTAAEARDAYVQLLTDAQFTSTTRRAARCLSQNQTAPVYRYFFTHKHSGFLGDYGSYHGMELFYAFNTWENSSWAVGPLYTVQDDSVASNMLNYWVNFAATGDPNGNDLIDWPTYDSASDCYLEIKPTPDGSQCGIRSEKSDLWDAVVGFVGCTTSVSTDENVTNEASIIIYPNPTDGIILFEQEQKWQTFEISIFDATGKFLLKKENETRLDITDYPSGVYFVTVRNSDKVITRKVVKR